MQYVEGALRYRHWLQALAVSGALAACGGGGSDSGSNDPGSNPGTTSGVPSLPADLLAQPAAGNCSALRSTRYRVVDPQLAPAGKYGTGYFDLNATTLNFVNGDGSTGTLVADGNCRFTDLATRTDQIAVSQAGIAVFRSQDSGVFRMGFAFPEQSHTLAELAGTWNMLGFSQRGTGFAADAATVTFNSSGASTAVSYCADVKTCAPETGTLAVAVNAAEGGFNLTFPDGTFERLFAYRAGGGELMLVAVDGDGSFSFWTAQRTNALPTVGTQTNLWNVATSNQLVATAMTVGGNTILTVDGTTGVFTRNNITVAPTTRPETLQANAPRPGYTLRNAATGVTDSSGAVVNVPEFVSLNLRGMGITPVSLAAGGQFNLSIVQ